MFAANPSVANAAGYASSHAPTSGPGDSLYGASAFMSSFQARVRNSALPPRPNRNAARPPGVPSPVAAGAGAGFGAFRGGGAPSPSPSIGGAGGFAASFSSLSSAGDFLLDAFSSPPVSSDSDSSAGAAPLLVDFLLLDEGVLPFFDAFFFFASAERDAHSTNNNATMNASARATVECRCERSSSGRAGNRIFIPQNG